MTVEKFIDEFNKATDKERLVKKHIVDKYIPYEEKIDICTNIIQSTSYIKDTNDVTFYRKNTPFKFLFFMMRLISEYTDIEFEIDETLSVYNKLESCGFINMFSALVSQEEYQRFKTILQMVDDDFYCNNRDIASLFDSLVKLFEEAYVNSIQ